MKVSPASESLVWVNGVRTGRRDGISPRDRGFTLGDGVFETMRSYSGHVFRLGEHLERMAEGALRLGIGFGARERGAIDAALQFAGERGNGDAAIRVTLTRGEGAPGLASPENALPTVVVSVSPLPEFPAHWYTAGITAITSSGRRNERSVSAGIKSLGYVDSILAYREARAAGADDAIMLDTAGHLSEGSASNIFVVSGDELATPLLSCGALPGITRAEILRIARHRGPEVVERIIDPAELLFAREAFLTSSLREIVPLVRLDGQPIGNGSPGPVTREMMEAYGELVRST